MSATLRKKRAARKKRFFQEGRRRIKKRLANTPGPERPATHDDRHQYPLRTGRSRPGTQCRRHRRHPSAGSEDRARSTKSTATLHLLKRHLPYHESDHVLNIAFNILAGGKRIEHLELRRNDEVYLDALGAERIPDPTTAGDFCRRFSSRPMS